MLSVLFFFHYQLLPFLRLILNIVAVISLILLKILAFFLSLSVFSLSRSLNHNEMLLWC